MHSASCGGTGAWPFASGRPTTAAGLEIITRVIRAARNFQNLDRFPQMSLLLCRARHPLGRYALCVQDVLLGPCVNIKISHCALCQDSGLKIWLAENEESRKGALTVAGGSHFLIAASDDDDLHGKSRRMEQQCSNSEDEDVKDGWGH